MLFLGVFPNLVVTLLNFSVRRMDRTCKPRVTWLFGFSFHCLGAAVVCILVTPISYIDAPDPSGTALGDGAFGR